MSLRVNDIAPDFRAETRQGPISFHEWIGDDRAVLFSHPKDFTPAVSNGEAEKSLPGFKTIKPSLRKTGQPG